MLSGRFTPNLMSVSLLAAVCTPVIAASSDSVTEEVVVTYQQAYRGDIPQHEQPQAIETIDSEQLEKANITDLQTALDFTPTVSRQNDMGGLWDAYTLRGFPSDENMPASYLINGYSGGRGYSGRRDASNIESVEVLLGPGSALYGRSDPGGTINIITLKPEYETSGKVSTEIGSFNHKRVAADLTGALGDNVAGRINGAWEDSDSFRDEVTYRKHTITPSVQWDVSDASSVLYEGEYVQQEAPLDRGIVVLNNNADTVDHSNFYGEPSDGPMHTKGWGHQLSFQHELENGWQLNTGMGMRSSHFRGYSSEPDLSDSRQVVDNADSDSTTLYRMRRYADYKTRDTSLRAELSGQVETGAVVHHLMAGADTYRYFVRQLQLEYRGDQYGIDLYNPVYGSTATPDFRTTPKKDRLEYQQAFGVYLQDQMELTERLQVLLGARFDNYHQSMHSYLDGSETFADGQKISPRYGVTYQLTDDVQLYANHATGFMPINGVDANGNAYDPEESRSNEIGSKFEVLGWNGSLAVFDAYKSNILTANTDTASSTQIGEIRSTGVEFSLNGQLSADTSLLFSYAFLNSRTTNTFVDASWGVEIPAGTAIANVPENTLFTRINHDFVLAGYASNAGASYQFVDERQGSTINPDYVLPSYSLVDVDAGMDFANGFRSQLAVTNVLNKSYLLNSYNQWWTQPGEPRAIKASVTYAF